jgi:hypothetical protein
MSIISLSLLKVWFCQVSDLILFAPYLDFAALRVKQTDRLYLKVFLRFLPVIAFKKASSRVSNDG